jgi:hypothetical protein
MLYQEWKNQIGLEKKVRNYQHIDGRLDLNNELNFLRVVDVLKNIKGHQFLPFIKKDKTEIRFRRSKNNPKGRAQRTKKVRPIMYVSHIDAHIYSYYNFALMDRYEQYLNEIGLSENVIAYRKIEIAGTQKGKSNINFAGEVFDYIKTKDECVVITHDIEHFFDEINHKLLKDNICKIQGIEKLDESFYKVFRSLTAYKYITHEDFLNKKIKRKLSHGKYAIYQTLKGIVEENRTNMGIPQGSPISGLLANIYLVNFDSDIKKLFPDVFYRRYSDDLVFVCNKLQKDDLLKFVDKKIKESLLKINSKKSFVSYFKRGEKGMVCEKVTNGLGEKLGRDYVDYLGFEFSGNNIFLRKNTIQKLKH